MHRRFAAICLLPAAVALGDLNYTADNRVVRVQNSFGQNVIHQPNPPFSPFHDVAQAGSTLDSGSCSAFATHDSELQPVNMSGSGFMNSAASATSSSGLLFGASGTSTFSVDFTLTAASNLSLSGGFSGTAGKSTFNATLAHGATTLFSTSSAGSFIHDEHLVTGTTYTLTVTASCNSFAKYVSAPVSDAATANFFFVANLVGESCTGDLNNDNVVDDSDFVIFVNAYNILDCADPAMPAGCPADFNHDHVVDDADFVIFVPAYDALECPK